MSKKIAVIGDAFVDVYHIGSVRGMSAEAPIPIVDIQSVVNLPGGAGNVTVNIDSLGGDVFYLEGQQDEYPHKNRLMSAEGTQLARWDEDDHLKPYQREDMLALLDVDAVIVSDYGKGSINGEVIQILRDVAQVIPVFVDTKGDPSPWIGADVTMFPNLAEYARFKEQYDWFPQVVLKRGKDGLAFMEFGNVVFQRSATAEFIRSVNGAGDTVIAAFVLAALAELALPECMEFANTAAGIVVGQHFLKRTTTRDAVLDVMFPEEGKYAQKLIESPNQTGRRGGASRYGLVIDVGSDRVQGPSDSDGLRLLGAGNEQNSPSQMSLSLDDEYNTGLA